MAETSRLKRTLPYLIGGVAAGAALGVLFAPKSGTQTRRDLADWLKLRRERTREFLTRVRSAVPAKKEQVLAAFRAGKEAYREADSRKELVEA